MKQSRLGEAQGGFKGMKTKKKRGVQKGARSPAFALGPPRCGPSFTKIGVNFRGVGRWEGPAQISQLDLGIMGNGPARGQPLKNAGWTTGEGKRRYGNRGKKPGRAIPMPIHQSSQIRGEIGGGGKRSTFTRGTKIPLLKAGEVICHVGEGDCVTTPGRLGRILSSWEISQRLLMSKK